MTELKLAQLPDRTPIKLAIAVSPDLKEALGDYGEAYQETYGRTESVPDLIRFMLQAFLESDRAFAKRRARG